MLREKYKDELRCSGKNTRMNSDAPGCKAIAAPLVTHVMLLLLKIHCQVMNEEKDELGYLKLCYYCGVVNTIKIFSLILF